MESSYLFEQQKTGYAYDGRENQEFQGRRKAGTVVARKAIARRGRRWRSVYIVVARHPFSKASRFVASPVASRYTVEREREGVEATGFASGPIPL